MHPILRSAIIYSGLFSYLLSTPLMAMDQQAPKMESIRQTESISKRRYLDVAVKESPLNPLNLTLTITQRPLSQDCRSVITGLNNFNLSKTGIYSPSKLFKSTLSAEPFLVLRQNHALLIDDGILEEIRSRLGDEKIVELLAVIEAKGHEYGAKRLFIECYGDLPLADILIAADFKLSAHVYIFKHNRTKKYFYKNVEYKNIGNSDIDVSFVEDRDENFNEKELKPYMTKLSQKKNIFGVFLHDQNGLIQGGLYGKIAKDDTIETPYSYIYCLWVHSSLNGKGMGTILMQEAEKLSIQQGVNFIRLDTNGYQAPGFYHKMGYDVVEASPDFTVLPFFLSPRSAHSENPYNPGSYFICTKKLLENPLCDQRLKPYLNMHFGSQVFLRPTFPGDYVFFLPTYADPWAMKYLGPGKTYSADDVKGFVQRWVYHNHQTYPVNFYWSIITHFGIAGNINILHIPFATSAASNEDHILEEQELAYCINPAFSGRGIATQASRLILDSRSGPFMATVHPENIGSQEVLKKLGFHADPSRMGVSKYGSTRDYYLLPESNDPIVFFADVLKSLSSKI